MKQHNSLLNIHAVSLFSNSRYLSDKHCNQCYNIWYILGVTDKKTVKIQESRHFIIDKTKKTSMLHLKLKENLQPLKY